MPQPRKGSTMSNSLLIGLSRQVALGRELDVVANNIANMNTTGFKADGSIFEEYLSPTARTGASADNKISFVRDRGTWHDMSQGPTEHTGNPLDVVIDGKGFLVVQTPRGERYTRNGSLQVGPTGNLMTAEGFPVVGDSGPITLQPNDRQISINAAGADQATLLRVVGAVTELKKTLPRQILAVQKSARTRGTVPA